MPYLGTFWAGILKTYIAIFEICTLEFVKNNVLTHTVNLRIGSVVYKDSGSAFSENPRPGLGPLYYVFRHKSQSDLSVYLGHSGLCKLVFLEVTLTFF